jgi:uncharacterized protein
MTDKLAKLVARRPWPFIIGFVLFALALGSQLPKAQVDPEVKNQLPTDFPARIEMDKIEAMFGGTELVMLTLTADDVLAEKTLERVAKISERVGKLPQVDKVLSLFELKDIKNVGDAMVVDPAVKTIPRTKAAREALRKNLRDNDLVYGSVVSKDFHATAVIGLLSIEAKDVETVAQVNKITTEISGPEPIYVAGMPIVRMTMEKSIGADMRRFLPLGLLIMLVFLFVFFRQLRGMLLPFFVVVMSAQVAMGLIPLIGWKIQMITIVLPVILLAIANDYGIHIIARYQEVNVPGNTLTKQELASNVFSELAKPIAIAGLTTIAGLMCLLMHIIVPAAQLGILASVGITYAVLASLFFIPALLAVLPKAKPIVTAADAGQGKLRLMDRMLARLAPTISRNPKRIIASFVGLCLLVGFGITRVEVDTNTVNYFPKDHPLRQSSEIADKHFGGSTTFAVAIKGDIKDPEVLRRLDHLEQKLEALPYVDQTTSIAKVIKQMNRVMNNDDPRFDAVPVTRAGVAQLLLMYENSGDPDDFDRIVDFEYANALLTARINTQSTMKQSEVIHFVRQYVKDFNAGKLPAIAALAPPEAPASAPASAPATQPADEGDSPFTMVDDSDDKPAAGPASKPAEKTDSPFTMVDDDEPTSQPTAATARQATKKRADKAPPARFTMLGGFAVLFYDLVDAVVYGQVSSLALSLLLVVIIVALLFRSLVAGLLAGGTLGLAMAFLFGLMGLLGIELNLPTALLSSIMIGVGVDYTIHFLWRYRVERRKGLDPDHAVVRTLTTTGRGIIINALSVIIGFAVMLISSFVPVRYFGFLVVVSIGACLLGAMVLMPALVLLIKPKFLEPKPVKGGAQ